MSNQVATQLCNFQKAQEILDQISPEDLVVLQSMSSALFTVSGVVNSCVERSLEKDSSELEDYLSCSRGTQWGILILLVYQLENSTKDVAKIWELGLANLKMITESLALDD